MKDRIPDTIVEHHFFNGTLATLPDGMRTPPAWAKLAAKRAWERGLGLAFRHITPTEIAKDPRGAIREMIAIIECLSAYVNHPSSELREMDAMDPELGELRKSMGQLIGKTVLKNLRKLDARCDALLPPATSEQLLDYGTRALKAIEAVQPDGDGLLARTLSVKIYYLIWFFWPELEKKEKLGAKFLHEWLADMVGVFASFKLVDAIYTELRMSSGRPRRSP